MRDLLIITPDPDYAASIQRLVRTQHQFETYTTRWISVTSDDCSDLTHAFHQYSDAINNVSKHTGKLAILFDVASTAQLRLFEASEDVSWPDNFNPIKLVKGEVTDKLAQCLPGLLILAYPEIHWIFTMPDTAESLQSSFMTTAHFCQRSKTPDFFKQLKTNGLDHYDPLFDGFGLRNSLMESVSKIHKMPLRDKFSLSLDEESTYAYMNSYAVYRLGYRSIPVMHARLLKGLNTIYQKKQADGTGFDIFCAIEDLFLNLPDKHVLANNEGVIPDLSILEDRDNCCPILKTTKNRIINTVLHERDANPASRGFKNMTYLGRNEKSQCYKIIMKPYAGFFDFLSSSGLKKNPDFTVIYDKNEKDDHSAPGYLVVIAESLLKRCRQLLLQVITPRDAICAAVLASTAKEILRSTTPTLSLEALSCQHEAEVIAESMFAGVSRDIVVLPRLVEIKEETDNISKWFNPGVQERSHINAQISIVENMVSVLRNLSQFAEEQLCSEYVRDLRVRFWILQKPWRKLVWPGWWYMKFSLNSLTNMSMVISGWILIPATLAWVLSDISFPASLSASMSVFFAGGGFEAWSYCALPGWWNALPPLILVASYVHLGLFIAYLYLMLSRK